MHKGLEEKFGTQYEFNKEAGKYSINNFYINEEYYSWNERLLNGKGKTLSMKAYFEIYDIK